MRLTGWLGAALLAAAALAGCGKEEDKSAAPIVGFIVPGSTVDGGWSQQGRDAMNEVEKRTGWKTTVVEGIGNNSCADNLRDFARRGAKFAVCHGFELTGAAEEVAKTETDMKIAVSGANLTAGGHILMMDNDIAGPSYQAGVLAGKLTKTGKIGFIAGDTIDPVVVAQKAFAAGLRSVRPDATLTAEKTNWEDTGLNKQQTEAFIRQGIDVIFQDVDTGCKGIFQAVKEHNKAAPEKPVWVFGCNKDQNENGICSEHTVGSVVIRLDLAFAAAAESVKNGIFKPGTHVLSIANGETVFVPNPRLAGSVITAEMQKAVDDAGRAIVEGKIKP